MPGKLVDMDKLYKEERTVNVVLNKLGASHETQMPVTKDMEQTDD